MLLQPLGGHGLKVDLLEDREGSAQVTLASSVAFNAVDGRPLLSGGDLIQVAVASVDIKVARAPYESS